MFAIGQQRLTGSQRRIYAAPRRFIVSFMRESLPFALDNLHVSHVRSEYGQTSRFGTRDQSPGSHWFAGTVHPGESGVPGGAKSADHQERERTGAGRRSPNLARV